jgi:hypothetical protein
MSKRAHTLKPAKKVRGKVKYAILGWLIGLPLPIVLILLFFRGCDF